MGKKRKHRDREQKENDNSEDILRRIKKLEKTFRKRRRRSHSYDYSNRSSSPGSESSKYTQRRHNDHDDYCSDQNINEISTQKDYLPPTQTETENNTICLSPTPVETVTQATSATPVVNSTIGEVNHLDEEIIALLGDAPKADSPVGRDIHVDIVDRLQDVLKNGLQKEQKEKFKEEYPIPGNCNLFKAPILNAEIRAAVSDILQKKDDSLAARQGQIGVALTALASALELLASDKSETSKGAFKHIGNAARLLCDSHNIDTKMRRNFLISTLNNKLKDTLKESKRDSYLFGEELPEKLRANKAITKTSQDLKSFIRPKTAVTKNTRPSNMTNNLNWKHPQSSQSTGPRKPLAMTHRQTAGQGATTYHRNQPAHRMTSSSRANKNSAHYRHHRRS